MAYMGSVRCDLGVAAVVTNSTEVLLVKEATGRYSGHWGLPKGYVDDGELPRDAALRELKEECDVNGNVTGIYAIRENLTEIGPAVFIAYSVVSYPVKFQNPLVKSLKRSLWSRSGLTTYCGLVRR